MVTRAVEICISGKVQGVFFRDGAKEKADELGLTGWVRNEDDGSLRIVAEGNDAALEKFVLWCKEGNEGARVERLDVSERLATGEFDAFRIIG